MRSLIALSPGPFVSVQDLGRPGWQRHGIVAGGAMDPLAFAEGSALLDANSKTATALEFIAPGGCYTVKGGPVRFALTGAIMTATLNDKPLKWATSFWITPGDILDLRPSSQTHSGVWGYLHAGGGFDVPQLFESRATHITAGFGGHEGRCLRSGDRLPIGKDQSLTQGGDHLTGLSLPLRDFCKSGDIRVLPGPQFHLFSEELRERFLRTEFRISPARNRMGTRLDFEGEPFRTKTALTEPSDAVSSGDIQCTGQGVPIVLLAEHQPTGGYPRIATVITADLAKVAQCPIGTPIRFRLVDISEARAALKKLRSNILNLPNARLPVQMRTHLHHVQPRE